MASIAFALLLLLARFILSTPLTKPSNATNGLTANCLTSDKFLQKDWIPVDCFAASFKIYDQEIRQGNPDILHEFYTIGQPPSPRASTKVGTPKKWTTNTCNIAIVTIDNIMTRLWRSELPGIVGLNWPAVDSATYRQVYWGAQAIKETCVDTTTAAWVQLGDYGGVGLFVWATGSWMDENFSPPYLVKGNDTQVLSMPSQTE